MNAIAKTKLVLTVATLISLAVPCLSQEPVSISKGAALIGPSDLPTGLATSHQIMGGRMTNVDQAQIILTGTTTDDSGSRSAQISIQAPGHFSYREGSSKAITFNGNQIQTKNGQAADSDKPVLESLLTDIPDNVFLQIANGGSLRRIGSHFRNDDGKNKVYTGPYWTVFAFEPKRQNAFISGSAQRPIFIAIDEQTGLIAEIRSVVNSAGLQTVTQTQFNNWIKQGGQWFPGKIIRLENGKQTLSFQATQATIGPAVPIATFQP